MKIKKLILLPALSLAITGCTQDPSFTESVESASSSSAPFSSSESSVYSDGSDVSSVTDTSSMDESTFNGILSANGVTVYRNPSNLSHNLSSNVSSSEGFVSFKKKMKVFSNKLSELFVKSNFKGNENFVLSPLSIELCLGLAIRCAEGETRNEILAAFGMDYETFNANYKLYFDYLNRTTENNMNNVISQLLLTNSIWFDDDIKLKDSGLDALRDDYYCHSYGVDFDKNNAKANEAMREFIKYNTKGLIDPQLDNSRYTLFVLINTLYSKALWDEKGNDLPDASAEYTFTNSNGTISDKRLLQGYYDEGKPMYTDDFSCFFTSLYGYRLFFVRPNEGKNLKDVFDRNAMNYVLDENNIIEQDDEKMEKYYTRCVFPQFNASGDFDLNEVLENDLGIQSLFDVDECNMSGITDKDVYCDQIRHIATLDVNKKGLEGAAVTYMSLCGAGMEPEDPYTHLHYTFVVDKEFGFIVTRYDSVVFSGVVNNIDK